jgi:hypothetical protein
MLTPNWVAAGSQLIREMLAKTVDSLACPIVFIKPLRGPHRELPFTAALLLYVDSPTVPQLLHIDFLLQKHFGCCCQQWCLPL